MHLTQELLSTPVTVATSVAGVLAFGAAALGARKEGALRQWPTLCAAGGLVFIVQALNLSTGLGFSGHLLGAALLALAFGPYSAMLVMGGVLGLQVGLLGDGSWFTLGANFLNLGVVAAGSAHLMAQFCRKRRLAGGELTALALAAYGSTLLASLSLALQLGHSFAPIVSAHAWIALIEVAGSLAFYGVYSARAEAGAMRRMPWKPLACAALLACALLPFSSELPDGLEHSVQLSAQR